MAADPRQTLSWAWDVTKKSAELARGMGERYVLGTLDYMFSEVPAPAGKEKPYGRK
jgi:hypothetical protein